ncbi:hypothetical protein [Sulfitobacter sp. S190]|uniref:hypothetical protein n=1 Tax=Sulfitobacter sp. S190 TaxID=2867022 RepID=UPI0021A93102|nr:hypothetical protein [Sulfitobacter sp. S190]UWR22694.1 hypothetical protein K3756_01465 [Sulfitobacter sp. S190]
MKQDNSSPSFLVFEQDHFVLSDISELLSDNFADTRVVMLNDLESLSAVLATTLGEKAVIISALPEEIVAASGKLEKSKGDVVAIMITDASDLALDVNFPCTVVVRPFSTAMLLDAIKTVIGNLPSFQS